MRILIIGPQHPDSFADNLVSALGALGHEVTGVPLFRRPMLRLGGIVPRVRDEIAAFPDVARRVYRHVIDRAEELRPNLVISVDYRLGPPMVRDLRAVTDGPIVFWFPDSPGSLRREMHVLCDYDAMFFKDSALVDTYRRTLNLNAFFLPEACNPLWHRPQGEMWSRESPPAVVVAGNMYASRFRLLDELTRRGIEVVFYGPPWARWLPEAPRLRTGYTGRYITREEKARVFRGACVVLNSVVSHEGDGLNARLFEAAGCGAVVLSAWRAKLPSLFDVPAEVATYRDFDELAREVDRLADLDPAARRAMGDAASARAHREHSYAQRFATICSEVSRG